MGEDYFKRRQAAVEQRTRRGGVGDRIIRELLGHSHVAHPLNRGTRALSPLDDALMLPAPSEPVRSN